MKCGEFDPKLTSIQSNFQLNLPAHFPRPKPIEDNLISKEKITLGRHLFYDKRLSFDKSSSCATCHQQKLAFTDGKKNSTGVTGDSTIRNSMAIINLAYTPVYTWNNNLIKKLRFQSLIPLFSEEPIELGLVGREKILINELSFDSLYKNLFKKAYPDQAKPINLDNITKALESFQRSIISSNSPYDQFLSGNKEAISEKAKKGADLFLSEKTECFHCHGGFNFTQTVDFLGLTNANIEYHNTGLYNIGKENNYPQDNIGLKEITLQDSDMGKFKAPTLRNIALTYPYMHDGSIHCNNDKKHNHKECSEQALTRVLQHYAEGGRNCIDKECTSKDKNNPRTSGFISGFSLSQKEIEEMLAFLNSLTDCSFIKEEKYSNPWPPGHFNYSETKIQIEDYPCR